MSEILTVEGFVIRDGKAHERIDVLDKGFASTKNVIANTKVYNVVDYGAVGDGIVDDSYAFRQAIAASATGKIYVPEGIYNLSGAEFSGKISLYGDGTIINMKYVDLSFPDIQGNKEVNQTAPYFIADGLTFFGNDDYGLHIVVNSVEYITRCFSVRNCVFYGTHGLRAENCQHSSIYECDFNHVALAVHFSSCTNITVESCHIFSPIIGVKIDESETAMSHRQGGESVKISNTTMIDGVTGIMATNHNYLYVVNCLIDYFNTGIQLKGARYNRVTQSYIGCNCVDKSARDNYIAPVSFNAVDLVADVDKDRQCDINITNCEVLMYQSYNDDSGVCVNTRNEGLPITEVSITGSRFMLETGVKAKTLLNLNSPQHISICDNVFVSVGNELDYVFNVENCNISRLTTRHNDFTDCFNGSVQYLPITGKFGNHEIDGGMATVNGNDSERTPSAHIPIKSYCTGMPNIMVCVANCSDNEIKPKLYAVVDIYDSNNIYTYARTIDGSPIPADVTVTLSAICYGI